MGSSTNLGEAEMGDDCLLARRSWKFNRSIGLATSIEDPAYVLSKKNTFFLWKA